MPVYKATLNKDALLSMPEDERRLFVTIAHLQNEIRFCLYGVVWSSDFSSKNEAICQSQISLNFFYLKTLSGKLYEGWQLLNKHYYANKKISKDFDLNSEEEGKKTLKELGKYFSSKNIVSEIRNNFSFHYAPERLDQELLSSPDDMDMYIAKENDANTLYYFAEVLANRGAMKGILDSTNQNPIGVISEELISIAKIFNKWNMLYMSFAIKKYGPEIWEGPAKEIEFDDLPKFKDIKIPLFTDTSEGFI